MLTEDENPFVADRARKTLERIRTIALVFFPAIKVEPLSAQRNADIALSNINHFLPRRLGRRDRDSFPVQTFSLCLLFLEAKRGALILDSKTWLPYGCRAEPQTL
jgi:hypothetical protein